MSQAKTTSILFYAINGTGLGHLSRMLAIARQARDLLQALGHGADFRILTTSEACHIAHDFPVYKIPSKTMARTHQCEPQAYLASSKMLLLNLVAQFRPRLLVLDTVPQGAFQEASLLRSLVGSMAFIDRHKDPQVASSPLHLNHLPLYDLILVPDDPDQSGRYYFPAALEERRRFVGCVSGYRPELALSRQQVRELFQVPPGRRLIYLSAGGGSDSRALLQHLSDSLQADENNHLLIGYGPLHRQDLSYHPRCVPLTSPEVYRYFPGVDAAISAAGYNSYQELLDAQVKTLFFAQSKGMDRQDQRVALGIERGWHGQLEAQPTDPLTLRLSLGRLLSGSLPAQPRPPCQGALRAALELLCLCGHPRAPLEELAHYRLSWSEGDFPQSLKALRRWHQSTGSPFQSEERIQQASAAWRDRRPAGEPQRFWARQLQEFPRRSGIAPELWWRFLGACSQGSSHSEAQLRQVLQALLAALEGQEGLEWHLNHWLQLLPQQEFLDAMSNLAREPERLLPWLESHSGPLSLEQIQAFLRDGVVDENQG